MTSTEAMDLVLDWKGKKLSRNTQDNFFKFTRKKYGFTIYIEINLNDELFQITKIECIDKYFARTSLFNWFKVLLIWA